jgi:hypothetical protein
MRLYDDRTRTQPIYQSLKRKPPKNSGQLCSCVNNVEETGIVDQLIVVANFLKNFGKTEKKIFIFGGYFFGKYGGKPNAGKKQIL